MAQHFYVRFTDDTDGSDLADAASVISCAFQGKEYTIDLNDENADYGCCGRTISIPTAHWASGIDSPVPPRHRARGRAVAKTTPPGPRLRRAGGFLACSLDS